MVTLNTFCPDADIYYAVNDSTVNTSSSLYETPIPLDEDATIYSAVYRSGKPVGKVTRKSFAVTRTGCDYIVILKQDGKHLNKGFGLTDHGGAGTCT